MAVDFAAALSRKRKHLDDYITAADEVEHARRRLI
jgi:hypothetical protein